MSRRAPAQQRLTRLDVEPADGHGVGTLAHGKPRDWWREVARTSGLGAGR
ncbi:hypothetical protein [Actinokineospora sp. HUAS TT18]